MGNELQVWNGTSWSVKADLPAERCDAASVVRDGRLLLIGGQTAAACTASVIAYRPETDDWAQCDELQLPAPRAGCKALIEPGTGHILVVGGDRRSGARPLRFRDRAWVELGDDGFPLERVLAAAPILWG